MRARTGHRARVLVRFCPAAVSKELLTSDFEQHFRAILGLGEARGVKKGLESVEPRKNPRVFEFRRMKKHVWEASWIEVLAGENVKSLVVITCSGPKPRPNRHKTF